jgi:lipopolysaccharide/colanic/teichoic acid biosynthesis glycosyltransferase/O-antigen/teichoic acid export membrane protein
VSRVIPLARRLRHPFTENVVALGGSMVALGVATLWVARIGGPVAVGDYALLRILPWLLAVIVSGGLAAAIAYFLAGPTRDDPGVRSTLMAMGIVSAIAGALLWLLATPLIHRVFFKDLAAGLVALVAVRVVLRLFVITGKAAAQGTGDLPGSNRTIVFEELMFLPAYGILLGLHAVGMAAIVGALILADLTTGVAAWTRLMRRGFLAGASRPSLSLARRIYSFGSRGQLGSLLNLLNLRFDFVFLAAIAGPAALGIYAVASKYAEVLRVVPIAANWVLYPRFARSDEASARATSRRLIPRAGAVTATIALPLAFAAGAVVPLLFGRAFESAVLPAQILFIGLAAEGVSGVITAFLYGRGHPGLNSLAAGTGLVVTLVLDVILIPRLGTVGAAIASSAAYLTTTLTLVTWYLHVTRTTGPPHSATAVIEGLTSVGPSRNRRVLDVAVALIGLGISWPLLVMVAIASRLSTHGSAIYRQVRVGQGGVAFPMYKFRSMRPGLGGPDITTPDDRRVTRVGALLRASSLDELPQLFNVLRGDMTLVGPRPETVALALRYPPEWRAVFAYRPGLTGPVQVTFRDAVPVGLADVEAYYVAELLPRRVELDLEYLANPTFKSTLTLMFATTSHVLTRVLRKREQSQHAGPGSPSAPGADPPSAAPKSGQNGSGPSLLSELKGTTAP